MIISARFKGRCAVCRAPWGEGEAISWQQGARAICLDCLDRGESHPESTYPVHPTPKPAKTSLMDPSFMLQISSIRASKKAAKERPLRPDLRPLSDRASDRSYERRQQELSDWYTDVLEWEAQQKTPSVS